MQGPFRSAPRGPAGSNPAVASMRTSAINAVPAAAGGAARGSAVPSAAGGPQVQRGTASAGGAVMAGQQVAAGKPFAFLFDHSK